MGNDNGIYWIVTRDNAQLQVSTKRHETFESARAEAIRLAQKDNARFVVLAFAGAAQPSQTPVVWSDPTYHYTPREPEK